MSTRHQCQPVKELAYEIAALRVELALKRLIALTRKYSPDQPRIPAGQPGGGRWTDGGGDRDAERFDSEPIGELLTDQGLPISILEEEVLGGHTYQRHINKSEEYLKSRVLGSEVNVPPILTAGRKRAGSFTSLEAADKLVNATLSDPVNEGKLRAFASREFPYIWYEQYLHKEFDGNCSPLCVSLTRGERIEVRALG